MSDLESFCSLDFLETHRRMSPEEVPPNSFSSLFLACLPHYSTKALVDCTSVPIPAMPEPSAMLPTPLPPTPPQDFPPCPCSRRSRRATQGRDKQASLQGSSLSSSCGQSGHPGVTGAESSGNLRRRATVVDWRLHLDNHAGPSFADSLAHPFSFIAGLAQFCEPG